MGVWELCRAVDLPATGGKSSASSIRKQSVEHILAVIVYSVTDELRSFCKGRGCGRGVMKLSQRN